MALTTASASSIASSSVASFPPKKPEKAADHRQSANSLKVGHSKGRSFAVFLTVMSALTALGIGANELYNYTADLICSWDLEAQAAAAKAYGEYVRAMQTSTDRLQAEKNEEERSKQKFARDPSDVNSVAWEVNTFVRELREKEVAKLQKDERAWLKDFSTPASQFCQYRFPGRGAKN